MYTVTIGARSVIKRGQRVMGKALNGRYQSTSTMHDNDPEVLEREKQRNLSKTQGKTSTPFVENAPGWNESLATTSEAFVKADHSAAKSPQDLQAETVKYVHDRYIDTEGTAHDKEYYSHDKVRGPLSDAKGKEEVQNQEDK